jgi:hypothetical protein
MALGISIGIGYLHVCVDVGVGVLVDLGVITRRGGPLGLDPLRWSVALFAPAHLGGSSGLVRVNFSVVWEGSVKGGDSTGVGSRGIVIRHGEIFRRWRRY